MSNKKVFLLESNLNLSWWISRFENRPYKSYEYAIADIYYVVNKSNNDPIKKVFGSSDIDRSIKLTQSYT